MTITKLYSVLCSVGLLGSMMLMAQEAPTATSTAVVAPVITPEEQKKKEEAQKAELAKTEEEKKKKEEAEQKLAQEETQKKAVEEQSAQEAKEKATQDAEQEKIAKEKAEQETQQKIEAEKKAQEEEKILAEKQAQEKLAQQEAEKKVIEQKKVEETKVEESKKEREKTEEKKVLEEQKPEQTEEDEIKGIDTVSLSDPRGNWLFKRIWWEKAEEKYEKIRSRVNTVLQSRILFFEQRNDLDKNVLDQFYIDVGLSQGELQEILSDLLEKLEQERKEEGALNEQERSFLALVESEKKMLEHLKKEIEGVSAFDHEINEGLNKLMELINRVRGYENEAWNYFKEIARVLSDKAARELYYKMDSASKNINNVLVFIEQDFTTHFTQLLANVKQHVDQITNEIKELKDKGIDFKKQVDQVIADPIPVEKPHKEEPQAAPKPKTWIDIILSPLQVIWDGIKYVISWPLQFFGGGSSGEVVEVIERNR